MRNKNIYIILFAVAMAGLFIIQYQYLRISLNLARVQFSQKIVDAGKVMINDLSTENQLTFLLYQSLTEDDSYFRLSVDSIQDASRHYMDDFIRNRLIQSGIEYEYDFQLFTRDSTYYLHSPQVLEKKGSQVYYPMELKGYLPELLNKNLILELHFNNLNSYFLSQLNGMIIPSIIFILIIIVCIIWIMRSYLSQQKLITSTNDFINNFTHELKTPVFSIGVASKILENDVPDNKKQVFEVIQQQTKRLKNHIEKILELSKIESARELYSFKYFDFEPSLKELCTLFQDTLEIGGGKFSYEISDGPYRLKGVPGYLETAVLNILDNSKKFSKNPVIELTSEKNQGYLIIRISDNGPGIGKEHLDRVFQKHVRIPSGQSSDPPGYGLGLSYVKEIMKKHRGKISIKSIVNKGTKVTLRIPLKNG